MTTIEASATLPAGWYTDPGQSGAKRWWDGSHWTEHLKKADPVSTPGAAKPILNVPYGLQGVVSAPRAPIAEGESDSVPGRAPVEVSNNAAWVSLLFGLLAVGFTVITALPVSQTLWVGGAALVSLIFFVVAVARRMAGSSTNIWAPVLGIALGVAATISLVSGVGILSLVSSIAPATPSAAASALPATVPHLSAEPLVFSGNAELTGDEVAVQTLATAINRTYANGSAKLGKGDSWPAALTMKGSTVVDADGNHLIKLASGLVMNYSLAANGTSYHLAVTGANTQELATYDSSANGFSWSCLGTDPACVPSN